MNGNYYYICILQNQTTDMRKYFIIMAAVFFCCSVTFGQKKNNTSVGVVAGVNLSTFRTPLDYDHYEADGKGGVAAGIFVERTIGSKFALQANFLYSQMGARVEDLDFGKSNFRYNYFSVPLVFKYNFCGSMRVFAGPQCDFLLRATDRNQIGDAKFVTNDTKDIDLAWTAGIETQEAGKVHIGARYISGTKDVSTRKEEYTGFNQGIQIYAAYKIFPLKKKK
jgi:hypothetical protein